MDAVRSVEDETITISGRASVGTVRAWERQSEAMHMFKTTSGRRGALRVREPVAAGDGEARGKAQVGTARTIMEGE